MSRSARGLSRRKLASHLSFGSFFYLKNDLTIFQLTEKDFKEREVKAQVLNHPELKKSISFDEFVYLVEPSEVAVISLLVKGYNCAEN